MTKLYEYYKKNEYRFDLFDAIINADYIEAAKIFNKIQESRGFNDSELINHVLSYLPKHDKTSETVEKVMIIKKLPMLKDLM